MMFEETINNIEIKSVHYLQPILLTTDHFNMVVYVDIWKSAYYFADGTKCSEEFVKKIMGKR